MISLRERSLSGAAGRTGGIPGEMQDAVEMWARSRGRHAKLVYLPALRTYAVEIDLKGDDPRMKGWQEGRLSVKPTETVYLHYQPVKNGKPASHFVPMQLGEMGVEGLLEILNRGDTTSGRGEFSSPQDVVQEVGRRNDALEESVKKAARDNARQRGRDLYRHSHVPKTTVTADIGE